MHANTSNNTMLDMVLTSIVNDADILNAVFLDVNKRFHMELNKQHLENYLSAVNVVNQWRCCNMFEFIKNLFVNTKCTLYVTGPNTLSELLTQFDLPAPAPLTPEAIVKHYTIMETMASLELSYLKEAPALFFQGTQVWYDVDKNKNFDFVYCAVRPEVPYCCYGKN